MLIEITCGLHQKQSHEINKLEDKRKSVFNQKIFKVRT